MRPKYLLTLIVLLALAVASAPTPAQAGGIVSVCDEANLLAALAGGGTVTFSCSGTITLTARITIAADTTIDGSGQNVTISGNHAVRAFTVNTGVTLNLNRLTVVDGRADSGGGGINNSGTVTVSNSTFSGNNASGTFSSSGGIYNSGTVTVTNSTFSSNSATSFGYGGGNGGGGINNSGTLTVSNSTFSSNNASGTFSNCGGIYNSGTVTVTNSTFAGNSATNTTAVAAAGGILNGGVLTVSDSTFSANSGVGGGIANTSGSLGLLVAIYQVQSCAAGSGGKYKRLSHRGHNAVGDCGSAGRRVCRPR